MSPVLLNDDNYDNTPKEIPKEGWHLAKIYAVIPLGLQEGGPKYPKPKDKLAICFELDEKMSNGKLAGMPFGLTKIYTNSPYEESKLMKELIKPLNIRIEPRQDLEKILVNTLVCVDIAYEKKKDNPEKVYANIVQITRPRPDDMGKDWELFNGKHKPDWTYPPWIQKKRNNAIKPPSDEGCQWEPDLDEGNKPQPVYDNSTDQSGKQSDNPPDADNDMTINSKIPF